MLVKIFTVPIVGGETENDDLNKFLAVHRIIDVQQVCVGEKYWSFCVRYQNAPGDGTAQRTANARKVDYQKVLGREEFERFARLRHARREIAQADDVPAYVIFTDAELGEMAKLDELTISSMKKINGVGKSKIENYAQRLLDGYQAEVQASVYAESDAAQESSF